MFLCLATREFSVLEEIKGSMKGVSRRMSTCTGWVGQRCKGTFHVCNQDSLGVNCGLSVTAIPMWMRRDQGQSNLQEPLSKTMNSNQEMQMMPKMLDVTCQLKGVKPCFHSQARKLEISKGAAHRVRRSRRPFSLSEAEKGMNLPSLHGRHCAVYTRSLRSLNQYFHF